MSQEAQPIQGAPANAAIPADSLRAEIDERRATKRRFDVREAIGLLVPLCTQLAEVHAQGKLLYVHPSSLRLVHGALLQPVDEWTSQPPSLPRDRACLAPEERKGGAGDARASVFAVGAMLYELITGEVVGPGMRRPSECVSGLPASLEGVLGKALVSDPKHRPADLAALAQALYQTAPGASMAPPPADTSHLDGDGEFEVDVRLSMIPPNEAPQAPIPRAPGVPRIQGDGPYAVAVMPDEPPPSFSSDPTRRLADMKARLESDPRPRYVVVKDGMDHGPFSAVELLQQIATGSFTGEHVLRDSISSDEHLIKEWDTFAPFAEQAKLNRDIKEEKQAFEATVVREKQGTQYKALVGAFLMLFVAAIVAGLILRERHNREIERDVMADKAVAVDVDGGLAGQKSGAPGAGGPRTAGGGNYPVLGGGMSCEAAQARYVEEYKMGNNGPPDLTAGAYGAVLNRGSYLNACGVPPSMTVNVCAAVQNGRAVGVTVSTSPHNGGIASCVAAQVRALSFPSHPRLDVARTTFAAN
ncbi:MAG TPA: hypothetical protein VHB21_00650 [Minicystis sp.]|nr:hypothetical protein [Minicystis sp.]